MNDTVVLSKNLGRIKLTKLVTKDAQIMAAFFESFTPLKFELDLYTGNYLMICESELFNDIKEGEPVPFYEVEMTTNKGKISVSNVTPYL